jgi:hypothetical protein
VDHVQQRSVSSIPESILIEVPLDGTTVGDHAGYDHHTGCALLETRYHRAGWLAGAEPGWWPVHEQMQRSRGNEKGCKFAEAFNRHPQSPAEPTLP